MYLLFVQYIHHKTQRKYDYVKPQNSQQFKVNCDHYVMTIGNIVFNILNVKRRLQNNPNPNPNQKLYYLLTFFRVKDLKLTLTLILKLIPLYLFKTNPEANH